MRMMDGEQFVAGALVVLGVLLLLQRRVARWIVDQTTGRNVRWMRKHGAPELMQNYEEVAAVISVVLPLAAIAGGIALLLS